MNDAMQTRQEQNLSLPSNIEAETFLLGAILSQNKAYDRVADFLRPEHFSSAAHGAVFAACMQLIEAGRPADPVIL